MEVVAFISGVFVGLVMSGSLTGAQFFILSVLMLAVFASLLTNGGRGIRRW